MLSPLHLAVTGERGSLYFRNPLMPKLFGRLTVTVDGKRRTEAVPKTSTYAAQLAAFRDAIVDGTDFPTTAQDAVANMTVIDAIYRAAGETALLPSQ